MKLAFGLMRLPLLSEYQGDIDLEQFKQMADLFISEGGTYFDTAYMYHDFQSENFFRKAVAERYPREAYTVTDKMPLFKIKEAADLPVIFAEQLQKCGVEYFDYYWLHCITRKTYEIVKEVDGFAFIRQMKAEGKAKHIGFSYHADAELLDEILTLHPEVEYVQLQLNYLDWEDEEVQSRKNYEVCLKHNTKVMVMEPIKGGLLANVPAAAQKLMKESNPDASIASWAVRYTASLKNVEMVLSGMSNLDQMKDNLSYMKDFQPITEAEKEIIDKTVDIIHSTVLIPCTKCRYCTSYCPNNLAIPDYFELLNDVNKFGDFYLPKAQKQYDNLVKEHTRAAECLQCGACEGACPQHIEIINFIQKVSETFDK